MLELMKNKNKLDLIIPYINKHIDKFSIEFISNGDKIIGVCLINWIDMVVYININNDPDFIKFDKNVQYISYQYKLYNMDEFLKIWDGITKADIIISDKNNLIFFLTDYLKKMGYLLVGAMDIPGGLDRTYLNRNINDNKIKIYENMIFNLLKSFNIRVSYILGEIQYLSRPEKIPYKKPDAKNELYYISGHATRYYSTIEKLDRDRIITDNNMSFFIFTDTGVPLEDDMMFFINYGIKPYIDEIKELAFTDINLEIKLNELEFKIYSNGLLNIDNFQLTSLKFDIMTFLKMSKNELNVDNTKLFLRCPVIDIVKYISFEICSIREEELPLNEDTLNERLKPIIHYWNLNSSTQLYEPLVRYLTGRKDELSISILKIDYITWWKKLKGLTLRRYYLKSIPNFRISFSGDNKFGSPMGVFNGPFPDDWIDKKIHTTMNIVNVPGESFGRDIYLNDIIETFKKLKMYSQENKYIFLLFICNTIELEGQDIITVHNHTNNLNKLIDEIEPIKRLRRMSISYKEKYLKYKQKYLLLKNQVKKS